MTSLVAMPELAALVVLALCVTLTFCGNQSEVSSSLQNTQSLGLVCVFVSSTMYLPSPRLLESKHNGKVLDCLSLTPSLLVARLQRTGRSWRQSSRDVCGCCVWSSVDGCTSSAHLVLVCSCMRSVCKSGGWGSKCRDLPAYKAGDVRAGA